MQVPLIPIILNPDSVVAYNSDNLSMHEHYVLKTISDESKTISDESKTVGIYIYIYIFSLESAGCSALLLDCQVPLGSMALLFVLK
jgi:hypothetical protein